MIHKKIVWPLAALLLLIALPAQAGFLEWRWERYMDAGVASYERGNYARAERQMTAALTLAKGFGEDHPNVATSLNNLASLYYAQDRLDEAEPLFLRALDIWKTALGPNHPNVAKVLVNLAALNRAKGNAATAERFDRWAEAIRSSPLRLDVAQADDMAASKTPQIDAAAAREVIASGAIDQEVAAIDPVSRGASGQVMSPQVTSPQTASPQTASSEIASPQTASSEIEWPAPEALDVAAQEPAAEKSQASQETLASQEPQETQKPQDLETKVTLLSDQPGALLAEEKVSELAQEGVVAESPNDKVALLVDEEPAQPTENAVGPLLIGNSMTGFAQGGWWTEYFAPDGSIKGLWRNKRYKAKWSIEGDTLCLDYPTRGRSCVLYALEGDQIVFYRPDGKGGKKEYKFLPGNPRNL